MLYVIVFFLSVSLTFVMRKIAIKKSLLAIPNARSSHTVPTPHGGGVAIAISWFVGLTFLYLNNTVQADLFYALFSGIFLALISFIDDVYELNPKIRIIAQLITVLLGLYFLGGLTKIDFGFFLVDNPIVTNVLAIFAIIWFINLYNFLDGIDGYAGSEALFLTLAAFVLFGEDQYLVLAASVMGFLIFNWHKAKIFMGDVGSTLLGYNIAIFAVYQQNSDTSILVWLILFGLFWFDATLTLVRRFLNKEQLTKAHKKHAYQRLVQSGLRHDKVVLLGFGVNLGLFLIAYFAVTYTAWSLGLFIFTVIVLWGFMKLVDNKKEF